MANKETTKPKTIKVLSNFFDDAPISKNHLIIIAIIAVAFIFEQADNYNFTFVAPTLIEYWNISVQQIGHINTFFAIGMLIGSFIFGLVSDRFGRKKAILIASSIFSLFSLLNGLAPNPTVFAWMRLLTGVGICGVIVVAPTYLIEFLPSKNRGRIYSMTLGAGYIGIPIIAVVCNIVIPMGEDHWRWVFIMGAIGFLVTILGLKWLKESPRWLVSKGRVAEAEKIVEDIVGTAYKSDLSNIKMYEEKIPLLDVLKIIFSKRYLKDTIALLAIYCIVFPGGLIFVNYASSILVDRGFTIAQGLRLSTLMSFGLVAGPVVATIVAEWGGRKWPIVLSSFGLSMACLVYTFLNSYDIMCVIAVTASMLVQVTVVLSSAYGPELYPTRIRNAATGLVGTIGRICTIILMAIFPVMYTNFGYIGVYIFLCVLCLITVIAVGIFGRRTGASTLEDMTE